ncbi:unnamed protein product [Paramecium sonneborni]|uniref:non-specific serine/threonine protein kinase n=1 Tax=Paramecium sonneborni TaxID=65129 RepID=A0A8S1QA73_9CILI|nr:unnamed protein product [Paramecium sonneborni]
MMKNFIVFEKLGEGSFSTVLKVKRQSDQQEYAMKKVRMGQLKEKEKENSLNEIRILASIQHPNIIGYKEAFYEEQSQCLCIVMEYADQGDLQQHIQQHIQHKQYFQEIEIWKMIYQVVLALRTLHQMKILHRDLKSANVFLHQSNYKLGDMNVSKVAKKDLVYTQTGTPYYASPEVWRDQPYDAKSDIWSLGCVAYEMATLKPPFRAQNMEGLYKRVQRGLFERIPSKFSGELMTIIGLCLQVQSKSRPSCNQLLNNPILLRNARQFITESRISQQTQSSQAGSNILLQTIKLPKNLKQLKEKLPKSKYLIESANKSYDESQVNSTYLPKIHNQKEIRSNCSVPPLKSDRYQQQQQQQQQQQHAQINSLHEDRSKSIANSVQMLEQERIRQKKLLEKQQNLKISVIHQNAIPYINSSSSQIQNLYLNKPNNHESNQQKQYSEAPKPIWWG